MFYKELYLQDDKKSTVKNLKNTSFIFNDFILSKRKNFEYNKKGV